MNSTVTTIPIVNLLIGFAPVAVLLLIMRAWSLNPWQAIYANLRMLVQLLLIGYVLTLVFEAEQPWIVVAVVVFMIAMSAWIALRPLSDRGAMPYATVLVGIGVTGGRRSSAGDAGHPRPAEVVRTAFRRPPGRDGVREQHEHDQPGGGSGTRRSVAAAWNILLRGRRR